MFNLATCLHPEKVNADLAILEGDINNAMIRQPGLFAYYSSLSAQAERDVNRAEQLVDITEATLDKRFRDLAAAAGEKRTESQIKSLIQTDPKMIKARQALNDAIMMASIAKGTAEAFRHRRDMLIQVAVNFREEGKGQLRVMDQQNRDAQAVRAHRAERLANKEAFGH